MDLEDRCSLYQRHTACGISIELALPVVPDLAAPRNFNPIGNKSGADPSVNATARSDDAFDDDLCPDW